MIIKNKEERKKLNVISPLDLSEKLVESFNRTNTLHEFLLENGDDQDMRAIYEYMALCECYSNENSSRFMFENGIEIPGINSRLNGKTTTLSGCAKTANSPEDFVEKVNKQICERFFEFNVTPSDKVNLIYEYKKAKK